IGAIVLPELLTENGVVAIADIARERRIVPAADVPVETGIVATANVTAEIGVVAIAQLRLESLSRLHQIAVFIVGGGLAERRAKAGQVAGIDSLLKVVFQKARLRVRDTRKIALRRRQLVLDRLLFRRQNLCRRERR